MLFLLDTFGGIAPKVSPKKLPEQLAQIAENCVTRGGQLQPLNSIQDEGNVANDVQSLFYDQILGQWITSVDPRTYVRPFLEGDTQKFTYFTDGVKPKFCVAGDFNTTYELGIPRPGTPNTTIIDAGGGGTEEQIDVSYAVAWVDGFGRLGPTSEASVTLTVGTDFEVQIQQPTQPTGNWYATGATWRIYRTNTGTSATEFQYIGEATLAEPTFNDTLEPDQALEVAESELWIGPPDASIGLTQFGKSLFCYTENEVYGSEPEVPHGFPFSWAFQEQVRGIVALPTGVLVVTDGTPYLLAGSDPYNMQKQPLESNDACLSDDSLVDMGGSAIYASSDGLIGVAGANTVNLTADLFDKPSWAAFSPTTIRAFRMEQFYVGFYSDDDGFIFDPRTKDFKTLKGMNVLTGAYDPDSDSVGVLYSLATDLRRGTFDAGTPLTYRYRSRVQVQPNYQGYTAVRVEADAYPLTLTLRGDAESDTITIEDREPHRLPQPYVAKNWDIEVEGNVAVDLVGAFESMGDVV